MARTARPRVSKDIAAHLRSAVTGALERRDLSRYDLGREFGDDLPAIGDRTIERAFSDKEPLLLDTAMEIVVRCRRLGIRLPADLLAQLLECDSPVVLIPRGEARRLADALAAEASAMRGVSPEMRAALAKRFRRTLERYENATEHWAIEPLAAAFMAAVQDTFRRTPGGWRYHFGLLREAAFDKGRGAYTVKSPSRAVEDAFLSRRAASKTR